MEGLVQDLRYGLRTLRRSPGFATAAIVTLALGIGANSAVFSLVNSVLLSPLDYLESERLVALFTAEEQEEQPRNPTSPADFLDWRRQSQSFDDMTAARPWSPALTGEGNPEQLSGLMATPELFDLLGARAALGSVFHGGPELVSGGEGQPSPKVVVLGHDLWQRAFGGDPEIVGSSLVLDGESYAVLGVMPAGFEFPPFWATGAELWAPLVFTPEAAAHRGARSLRVFARLRPGVTLVEARAQMDSLSTVLQETYPETNEKLAASVQLLQEPVVASVRTGFWMILAAAGLVLLIACANIASLLLARGLGRRSEISLRSALGAGRLRLARQLLTESLLLSLAGCVGGAVLAVWGLDFLLRLGGSQIPRAQEVQFDGTAFVFTLGASLLTGLLFGLLPALKGSSGGFTEATQGRSMSGSLANRKAQGALIVVQVALAMLLLAGAGLIGRSLWQLQHMDPGFRTENLLTLDVAFGGTSHEEAERQSLLFSSLLSEVRSLPGVRKAGFINHLPIGGDLWGAEFSIDGRPEEVGSGSPLGATYRVATEGALEALGMSLRQGRLFDQRDRSDSAPVILINETLARRFFPQGDALGARMRFGNAPILEGEEPEEAWRTIVGVVSDVRQWSLLDSVRPEIYFPYGQNPVSWWSQTSLVIHTHGDPRRLADPVQAAVWSVDGSLPVSKIRSAADLLGPQLQEQRLQAWVFGLFAGFSLLLAAVGLYGTLSYQVRLRRKEIGIRLAIGAREGMLVNHVALRGLRLVAIGMVLGLGGTLILREALTALVFDLNPSDPLTLGAVSVLLFLVAATACWLPARRCARVDPLTVLREE
ncbi:MAG: ABC transporter permease [Deltaproteobacteria bacterium]|nr:ABC transporter permease [Deltaproteobacteria bacterium]